MIYMQENTHTHRSISAWVMIPILPAGWGRGEGGLSLLSLWPGENKRTGGRIIIIKKGGLSSYLPTVWLASCRIRLNCFFILYFIFFFCVNTYRGKYSALFLSVHNGPCSTEAQREIQSAMSSFPHREPPTQKLFPRSYIFSPGLF